MTARRPSGSAALNVAYCEGFRMPVVHGGAANSDGRRPKASKGGNRDDEQLSDLHSLFCPEDSLFVEIFSLLICANQCHGDLDSDPP